MLEFIKKIGNRLSVRHEDNKMELNENSLLIILSYLKNEMDINIFDS